MPALTLETELLGANDGLAQAAYTRLRSAILAGELTPDSTFSQLELARRLGVGRTPLREAVYRLQAEGLVRSAHRRRVQIASFSISEIEEAYCVRILLEAAGVRIAVPLMTEADIERLEHHLHAIYSDGRGVSDPDDDAHRAFHAELIRRAGDRFARESSQLHALISWYHRAHVRQAGGGEWYANADMAQRDHEEIFAAVARSDGAQAALLLAHHLGWTGLLALAVGDPQYDPARIRLALRIVEQGVEDQDAEARRGQSCRSR